MTTEATSEKITFCFGWKGPTSQQGGQPPERLDVETVKLVFKSAKTDISVPLPKSPADLALPNSPYKKCLFRCRKYSERLHDDRKVKILTKETHPDLLSATVEQINNLTIKAKILRITPEKDRHQSNREIKLKLPEVLEIGQTYCLLVASDENLSLSAGLIKEEKGGSTTECNRSVRGDEFRRRVGKMGEALIMEGMQNLDLASRGGAGVFDSSTTTADVFAHGMRGILRAGRHVNPNIEVPYSKPIENPSDLDTLTIEELQSRFEATFKKDKEFEIQRLQASMAGNISEMNRITTAELANSQLLINLSEALERKGVKPQIPQSECFQGAAKQSADTHKEALKDLEDKCKMQ